MSGPLVECVPNFSEGRDQSIIDQIIFPIEQNDDVALLDVDMGADFNRTVVTMVGNPEEVLNTVIECTIVASKLIDMRSHTGEHARMGAVDVVPFIPISKMSMAECVQLSNRYAEAVSKMLDLPVYLYAEAARTEQRVKLPDIRRGQYEGLQEKLQSEYWIPDYGPATFNPLLGATATGAREILIAFNVNLDTNDKSKANSIAGSIRTSGVLVKNDNGQKVFGEDGKPLRIPGRFPSLQAAGWMYDEETAQVSMNLLNHNETGLSEVTEAIKEIADEMHLKAVAGELVGLVPLQAMISAGEYYHENHESVDEKELVNAAISGLMLDKIGAFIPESSIIEWAIEGVG